MDRRSISLGDFDVVQGLFQVGSSAIGAGAQFGSAEILAGASADAAKTQATNAELAKEIANDQAQLQTAEQGLANMPAAAIATPASSSSSTLLFLLLLAFGFAAPGGS